MENIIKNLGGHSGCKIFLMEDSKGIFVRKVSSDVDYNKRLQAQMKKQSGFQNDIIKAPLVLNNGLNGDGLFYFDMEYIHGITLSRGIITENISDVDGIVLKIINALQAMDYKEMAEIDTKKAFIDKITDLKLKLNEQMDLNLEKAFNYLLSFPWEKIPGSSCHGDLTFENIILKNGNIYLIDFLDSFYDSWLLDISTLLQDSFMFWSYKEQKELDTNLLIRLKVFKNLLEDKVGEISGEYVKQIHALLLLKLIRIYPYVEEEYVNNFLGSSIRKMLNVVEAE